MTRVFRQIVFAALLVGAVAVDVGAALLPRVAEGGYSTDAIGAPAYAVVFSSSQNGRPWLIPAALLASLACVALGAAVRLRWRRAALLAWALLALAIAVLVVGLTEIPRSLPAPGGGSFGIPIRGRPWLDGGTAALIVAAVVTVGLWWHERWSSSAAANR